MAERLPADISPTEPPKSTAATTWPGWRQRGTDLWGRIRNLSDRALASYLALDETRVAAQMSLVSEVAIAYLTLRVDQALLTLTSDTLATQKRSYELTAQLRKQAAPRNSTCASRRFHCVPPRPTMRFIPDRQPATAMPWYCC